MLDDRELQCVLLQVQKVASISGLSLKAFSRVNEFVLFLYLDQYTQLATQRFPFVGPSEYSAAQLYLKFKGQPLGSVLLQEVRGSRGALAASVRELAHIVESGPAALLAGRFEEQIERAIVQGRTAFGKLSPVELKFDFTVSGKLDYQRHQRLYEDLFRLLMTGGHAEMLQEVIAKKNENGLSQKIQKIENRMKPKNCSLSESALNLNLENQKKDERRTNFKLLVAEQLQRHMSRVVVVLTRLQWGDVVLDSRRASQRTEEASLAFASSRPASERVSVDSRKKVRIGGLPQSKTREPSLDRDASSGGVSEGQAERSHIRQLEHFKNGTFYSSLVRKPRQLRIQSCKTTRDVSRSSHARGPSQKIELLISQIDLITGQNDKVRRAVDHAAASWRAFDESLQVKEKIFREFACDGAELA